MKKLIFLWIFLMSFQVFTQQKAVAVKFDEFSDFPAERISPFYDRTGRFGEKLKRSAAGQQAVIIYYNQRKGQFPLTGGRDSAQQAAQTLYYSYDISKDRIVVIDGGYREYPTLEFWTVPKGAGLPKPTPAFSQAEIVYCPEINIAGDGFQHDRKDPLKFSVVIKGVASNRQFPLDWSVSAGKITRGQGTNQIEVDLSNTEAKMITAAVIVKDLPPECDCHSYHSTEIGTYPYKVDEFSYVPYSDLSARMDGFYIQLINEPAMKGHIIIYSSRLKERKSSSYVINNIRKILTFRRYDSSRIEIIDGGFREEMWVEFYLLPPGIAPPLPTPTLNSDFVVEPSKKPKKRAKTIR